jgi:hypothetical protein
LVSDSKGRSHNENVWDQCAEGIFGLRMDEIIGGWRKLHNEDLYNLYSSPNIIRMMKSWGMGWVGHVARKGACIQFWWEKRPLGIRRHSKRIISKWILEKYDGVMGWIQLTLCRDQ